MSSTQESNRNQYVSIPENYLSDPFIHDLFKQIENTNESFYISGKAGTGKSTFLHYFAQTTQKNVVIAAFTGIAAINVGGVTLHSLFLFPFKPLLPNDFEIPRFGKTSPRRKLIEKMDTLVIDEISMVRADILEAIDYSLRINGGNPNLSFGGKQIIMIGDIFQLPPVVNDKEMDPAIFSTIYNTPFFFSAPAYRRHEFIAVEFTKIHRQSDEDFKMLLNKVRVGEAKDKDINRLNYRYFGDFNQDEEDFTLTLVTRNMQATQINEKKMQMIESPEFTFEAKMTGTFSKDRYPTDLLLNLKKDAQVIFIKNDITGSDKNKPGKRRWVNGTIAKIYSIDKESISVIMEDGEIYEVEKATWENKTYRLNFQEGKITGETIGTYTQYPIKLAWAITIHKSQGLTFDKVILDLGFGAFTHGQTYVALSRCRSLEGIILKREIRESDMIIDERVVEFYKASLFKEPNSN